MSASDDIKNMLGQVYGPTDWKRISKRIHKTPHNSYPIREFKNSQGDLVTVLSEMDDTMHLPYKAGNVVFGIYHRDNDINVIFADEDGYLQRDLIDVEYWDTVMDVLAPGVPSYLSRAMEAIFSVSDTSHDIALVRKDCEALGYTYSRKISEDWGDPDELDDPGQAAAQLIALTQVPVENDEYKEWRDAPFIIFGVSVSDDGIAASFATPDQWVRDGHIESVHVADIFDSIGMTVPDYLHEAMENCLVVWEDWMADVDDFEVMPKFTTKDQVVSDLIAHGFVFSPTLDALLNTP